MPVNRDGLVGWEIPNELQFVGLIGKDLHGLLPGDLFAHKRAPGAYALPHAARDLCQIIGCEWPRQVKIIIEPIFDGRANGQLGLREEALHCLGHDMGGRVSDYFETVCRHRTSPLAGFYGMCSGLSPGRSWCKALALGLPSPSSPWGERGSHAVPPNPPAVPGTTDLWMPITRQPGLYTGIRPFQSLLTGGFRRWRASTVPVCAVLSLGSPRRLLVLISAECSVTRTISPFGCSSNRPWLDRLRRHRSLCYSRSVVPMLSLS